VSVADTSNKHAGEKPVTDMTDRLVMGVTRARARTHGEVTNQSVTSVTGPPSAPASSLSRLLPRSPFDAEAIKRNGWLDLGVLVVSAEDSRLSWPERELIRSLGAKLYGHRTRGAHNG
jgi:hypothetical protein